MQESSAIHLSDPAVAGRSGIVRALTFSRVRLSARHPAAPNAALGALQRRTPAEMPGEMPIQSFEFGPLFRFFSTLTRMKTRLIS